MSQTVLLDPGIDLGALKGSGLLVGSYLPNQILGVYVAATPVEDGEDGPKGELDPPWMLEHAKQVLRMLPGGVHVIGFVFSDPEILNKSESKIRKLLAGLRGLDDEVGDVVFLVPNSKGLSLGKEEIKNITFKATEQSIDYVLLDTHCILDIPIAITCGENSTQMLFSQAAQGVNKFERTLRTGVCLVNSGIMKGEEPICPAQFDTKKRSKGKPRDEDDEEGQQIKFDVQILVKDDPNVKDDVDIGNNNVRIKLAGKLKSRACVPHGTSLEKCKQAVLQDIMRSLRGRILLHCDSLVGEEGGEGEAGDGPIVHEPPRRVFTILPGTQICISDYLYPGEGGEDAIESITEIFGFRVQEEDIEDDLELVAAAKEVKPEKEKNPESVPSSGFKYVIMALGVGALAALLAWFNRRSSDQDNSAEL